VLTRTPVPILGIAAYSGTGKTTLLRQILPQLRARGLRVAVIKHAHHSFDTDVPGKDSSELRKAGATQMLVDRLDYREIDLILVEGFKTEHFPKIELHRPSLGQPLLYQLDRSIVAIATDAPLPATPPIPVLDLRQPEQITEFIVEAMAGAKSAAAVTR
jgi:molybdopterin-guanine dinucleotide biosynthesis protein